MKHLFELELQGVLGN